MTKLWSNTEKVAQNWEKEQSRAFWPVKIRDWRFWKIWNLVSFRSKRKTFFIYGNPVFKAPNSAGRMHLRKFDFFPFTQLNKRSKTNIDWTEKFDRILLTIKSLNAKILMLLICSCKIQHNKFLLKAKIFLQEMWQIYRQNATFGHFHNLRRNGKMSELI